MAFCEAVDEPLSKSILGHAVIAPFLLWMGSSFFYFQILEERK